jgi:ubiquitin carboxyl-terminal hydrolase 14
VSNKKHALEDSEDAASADASAPAKKSVETMPYSFPDDPWSNSSGRYELAAVLTHKGRSTSSGHYVGWGKMDDDNGNWAVFDDDTVTPVKSKDVMQLSGELGGELHAHSHTHTHTHFITYLPRL